MITVRLVAENVQHANSIVVHAFRWNYLSGKKRIARAVENEWTWKVFLKL